MPQRLLVDTDIFVDYLRDLPAAVARVESDLQRREGLTSAVVVAGPYAGVREGKERAALSALLSTFEILPIDAHLAERGGLLRRDYGPKHGTGLADALIAATALRAGADLVTLNAKHFPMLTRVIVPYSKN